MTPAEHRAEAESLLREATKAEGPSEETYFLLKAQAHATLALAPAPPPTQPPQTRWDLSKPQAFPDATGGALTVTPTSMKGLGVVFNYDEDSWLVDNPSQLRTLASLLTAHANRLEPKP